MRIHTDRPLARLIGTAFGIGYCLVGLYSLTGSFEQADAVVRDRAFWFGITALVVGVVAVAVSWLEQRLDLVWCADPRRRARLRLEGIHQRDVSASHVPRGSAPPSADS